MEQMVVEGQLSHQPGVAEGRGLPSGLKRGSCWTSKEAKKHPRRLRRCPSHLHSESGLQ